MQYKNEIIKNGIIYSVDMLRLDFTLRTDKIKEIETFGSWLIYSLFFEKYTSYRFYNFRDLFVSECGLKIGLGFNGSKNKEKLKGFIEFNPNKQHDLFLKVKKKLHSLVQNGFGLKSYDIAIDIPEHRNNFFILKTQKHYRYYEKYIESVKTHSITEYLGKRNTNGFFKLYNKNVESKLDYDLTRAEITLTEPYYANFVKNMPDVLYVNNENFNNFIPAIQGLLRLSIEYNDFTNLNMLDYSTRQKIKKQLKYNKIDLTPEIFNSLIVKINMYINYK